MNTTHFTSTFATDLEEYVAFKKKMGFYGASRIVYLRRFDAYCTAHNLSIFDRATVEGWVTDQLQRSGRYRSWMSYIRDFGRWLHAHSNPDAYVLSDQWKASFIRSQPYLLTHEEIEGFFTAAADVDAQSPWAWQSVAFFTLMHSAGIRTGEARNLLTSQVDLGTGHIDIVDAKGRRSRRLPLTDDVIAILASCDTTSHTQLGHGGRSSSPRPGRPSLRRVWE